MRHDRRISLIIPCLNEEKGLTMLLPEIPTWVDEILVVDNGSTDRTADIARQFGARVVLEPRKGYGRAHRTGIAAAKGEILATLDGDGQYPPAALATLVDTVAQGNADLAIGCRVPFPPGSIPLARRAGNRLLNFAGTALFGAVLKDNQSGMWTVRQSVARNLALSRDDMAFSEEIKYKAARGGFRVVEVPITYRPRLGVSKLPPLSAGVRNLLYLVRLRAGLG